MTKRIETTTRSWFNKSWTNGETGYDLAEYFLVFLFTYVLTNVFYIPYYLSFFWIYVLDTCMVCTLRQDLERKGEYFTIHTIYKWRAVRANSQPKSTGRVIVIVGAAFHWGINGHYLFQRGFLTTKKRRGYKPIPNLLVEDKSWRVGCAPN